MNVDIGLAVCDDLSRDNILYKSQFKIIAAESKIIIDNNRKNSLLISKDHIEKICKFCIDSNNSVYNTFDKNYLYRDKVISLLENKSFKNLLTKKDSKMIHPCKCFLHVHAICLIKYIIISQKMQCPACKSIIIFNYSSKKNSNRFCIRKFFEKRYLIVHLAYIFTFVLCIFISIYVINREVNQKLIHFKYIFAVIFILLSLSIIIFYTIFVKKITSIPINEELNIKERGFNANNNNDISGINVINIEDGLKINKKKKKKDFNFFEKLKPTSDYLIKSFKTFFTYLNINFSITEENIIEYCQELNIRINFKAQFSRKVYLTIKEINENNFTKKGVSQMKISYYHDSNFDNITKFPKITEESYNLRNNDMMMSHNFYLNKSETQSFYSVNTSIILNTENIVKENFDPKNIIKISPKKNRTLYKKNKDFDLNPLPINYKSSNLSKETKDTTNNFSQDKIDLNTSINLSPNTFKKINVNKNKSLNTFKLANPIFKNSGKIQRSFSSIFSSTNNKKIFKLNRLFGRGIKATHTNNIHITNLIINNKSNSNYQGDELEKQKLVLLNNNNPISN